STPKGICYMAFYEDEKQALVDATQKFPNAEWVQKDDSLQRNALSIFQGDENTFSNIKLHLKGSEFQLKVWEMLLKIPMGQLATYGDIAAQVGKPNASRAVGTAIGSNPIAFLIPCHRVIQSSGNTGGYMWGTIRKTAIIAWESAKCEMKLSSLWRVRDYRMIPWWGMLNQIKPFAPLIIFVVIGNSSNRFENPYKQQNPTIVGLYLLCGE